MMNVFAIRLLIESFFFQHCNLDFGSYTKDLSAVSNDLSSVFILDNSPGAYRGYPGKLKWKDFGNLKVDLKARRIYDVVCYIYRHFGVPAHATVYAILRNSLGG